jgi:hypothetical protein
MTTPTRDDYDSPWKEALERYSPEFLALLYPKIHAEIDWTHGPEFLDKELQQVVRDAELGRRYADKLAKVYTRDGAETWVLIHVEVQRRARGALRRAHVHLPLSPLRPLYRARVGFSESRVRPACAGARRADEA